MMLRRRRRTCFVRFPDAVLVLPVNLGHELVAFGGIHFRANNCWRVSVLEELNFLRLIVTAPLYLLP